MLTGRLLISLQQQQQHEPLLNALAEHRTYLAGPLLIFSKVTVIRCRYLPRMCVRHVGDTCVGCVYLDTGFGAFRLSQRCLLLLVSFKFYTVQLLKS